MKKIITLNDDEPQSLKNHFNSHYSSELWQFELLQGSDWVSLFIIIDGFILNFDTAYTYRSNYMQKLIESLKSSTIRRFDNVALDKIVSIKRDVESYISYLKSDHPTVFEDNSIRIIRESMLNTRMYENGIFKRLYKDDPDKN